MSLDAVRLLSGLRRRALHQPRTPSHKVTARTHLTVLALEARLGLGADAGELANLEVLDLRADADDSADHLSNAGHERSGKRSADRKTPKERNGLTS